MADYTGTQFAALARAQAEQARGAETDPKAVAQAALGKVPWWVDLLGVGGAVLAGLALSDAVKTARTVIQHLQACNYALDDCAVIFDADAAAGDALGEQVIPDSVQAAYTDHLALLQGAFRLMDAAKAEAAALTTASQQRQTDIYDAPANAAAAAGNAAAAAGNAALSAAQNAAQTAGAWASFLRYLPWLAVGVGVLVIVLAFRAGVPQRLLKGVP